MIHFSAGAEFSESFKAQLMAGRISETAIKFICLYTEEKLFGPQNPSPECVVDVFNRMQEFHDLPEKCLVGLGTAADQQNAATVTQIFITGVQSKARFD